MAYTENEKPNGLDVLTSLDAGDLHVVGDVSDSSRVKAITQNNLETDIAQSSNFVAALIANSTFTTDLAGDSNFQNTLANDTDFITELTDNANFQSAVNTFVSSGGGGGASSGGGKPMTFALTDFDSSTATALNGYSDREALAYSNGSTFVFQDALGYTQSRDVSLDWASTTSIESYVALGSYIYVLASSGAALRVYRYASTDLSAGGTLMTFSGATLTYAANVVMTSDGTDFFFNFDAGQSANAYAIAKFTLSGTTLTDAGTVNCGSTATHFSGKLAVDSSENYYGTASGVIYQYNSSGTLTHTSGNTLANITKLFNWDDTLYGTDGGAPLFTKLYAPDTEMDSASSQRPSYVDFNMLDASAGVFQTLYSDEEAYICKTATPTIFKLARAGSKSQSRDVTTEYAAATVMRSGVILNGYLYLLLTNETANPDEYQLWRYNLLDVSDTPTQVTFSGSNQLASTNNNIRMTSDGTAFYFNYLAGNSANSYTIGKYTLSGTVLTYSSTITLSDSATVENIAVFTDGDIYIGDASTGEEKVYNASGTLQTTGLAIQANWRTGLWNYDNTIYFMNDTTNTAQKTFVK